MTPQKLPPRKSTRPSRKQRSRSQRQLFLEPLESRQVMATFVVNTFADTVDANPGDGLALDASGNTSLRAAVMEANALAGADEIHLSEGTYALTRTGFNESGAVSGDLNIRDDVSIVRIGTGVVTIDASALNDRIFEVLAARISRPSTRLTLDGLRLTGGKINFGDLFNDRGGAIRGEGGSDIRLSHCIFDNNRAPSSGFPSFKEGSGGAIASEGNLTIDDCRFENNTASLFGGAITANGIGTLVSISNSTFVGNFGRFGGALRVSTRAVVENCSFVGNVAKRADGLAGQGGAIEITGGNLTLTNCTVSGNDSYSGGGIFSAASATTRLNHCTVAFNTATYGGGLHAGNGTGVLSLENTIVGNNSATAAAGGPDVKFAIVSLGYNLISNTADSSGFGAAGDLLNVSPQLAALADNGGPTLTHALLSGSLALDAANPNSTLTSDQRGFARPRDANGDAIFRSDIGAFEDQSTWPPIVVAGGPYNVQEGGSVGLDASGSQSRQVDPSLTFAWDFDGDGEFDDAVGATPTFSAPEGPATFTVTVRVTDSLGLFSDGSAVVHVANAAPTIGSVNLNPSSNYLVGSPISLEAFFSDVGLLDTHTASVNWGDGSSSSAQVSESPGSGSAAASHTYASRGTFTIAVTVSDDDGGSTTWSTSIVVHGPPTASAGGPYTVLEGGSVTLDASGSSSDQVDPTLTYAWDLDNDGEFDDATGVNPNFSAANLDGTSAFTVGVRVTDSMGLSSDAFTTVTVANATPTITGLDVFPPLTVVAGSPVSLTVYFADAGVLDTHSVTVDWGDGTVVGGNVSESGGSGSGSSTHAYSGAGVFTIVVTVTDDDGASASTTYQMEVTGDLLINGVLKLIGTQGADMVAIRKLDDGSLFVEANFLPTGSARFAPGSVQMIVAHLAAGDDTLLVHRNVNIPLAADGGEGKDHLVGGGRNDILIGGLGADILDGNIGDDILINGTTDYDANDDALLRILSEWNSRNAYDVRVRNIRNSTGAFLGGTGVRLADGVTVHNDADADQLTGSAGRDWFFSDFSRDSITDRAKNEPRNDEVAALRLKKRGRRR